MGHSNPEQITAMNNLQRKIKTLVPRTLFSALALPFAFFALVKNLHAGFGDTAYGYGANGGSYGAYNSAFGYFALGSNDLNTSNRGNYNVGVGYQVLVHNFYGESNTAVGLQALFYNTNGSGSTALGYRALFSHVDGNGNTATGYQALYSNSSGNFNTATGSLSLYSNVGSDNTAIGYTSLYRNTGGNDNTAAGAYALYNNGTGSFNVATGSGALFSNTSGANNTAVGYQTLQSNGNSSNNTALGYQALRATTGGANNVAIGANAGANLTTGSNNIDIGANVVASAGESNTIRIGKSGTQTKTLIAGIYGKTVATGVGVIVGSTGQLGTVQSSVRFKDNINPMDKASEAVLALNPVTFRYKEELDPGHIPQFGLIAEQVEKVCPDLVVRDNEGKAMTVRYDAVNAMLLNEFLKEHRVVQQQQATINELKSRVATVEFAAQQQKELQVTVAQQQKRIEDLMAGLQKVSAQVKVSKAAANLISSNR